MSRINHREPSKTGESLKRRVTILEKFPDERLESIIIQWEDFCPTVLVQLFRNPQEPVRFPGKRPEMPAESSDGAPTTLELPLVDFLEPTSNLLFSKEAFFADILFSQRAYALLQPEPDLVLPDQAMWECRAEALRAVSVEDEPGLRR